MKKMAKIKELKSNCFLTHSIRDLAPSDYFLFPNLKKWVGGKIFANNEEIKSTINGYFEEFSGSNYKQDIKAIDRWERCVKLKGQIKIFLLKLFLFS